MCGAGTDDGQSESDIDCGVEANKFDRDVSLIMVHGDNAVEFAKHRAADGGVGRERSADIEQASEGV